MIPNNLHFEPMLGDSMLGDDADENSDGGVGGFGDELADADDDGGDNDDDDL